jgi:hypothetical protein
MRGVLCAFVLLGVIAGPAGASSFHACPFEATIPPVVRLVGADPSGHPDPSGTFTVILRDSWNSPVPDATILVDFSAASDAIVCDVQALGVVRVSQGVEGRTDAEGRMSIAILGRAVRGAPASRPRAVSVFARCSAFPYTQTFLGSCSCVAFDLNGTNGVGGADLSLWLTAFVSGASPPLCDYNGSGNVGGADLSEWLRVFCGGGSSQTCPAIVEPPQPPPPTPGEGEPREQPRPRKTGP